MTRLITIHCFWAIFADLLLSLRRNCARRCPLFSQSWEAGQFTDLLYLRPWACEGEGGSLQEMTVCAARWAPMAQPRVRALESLNAPSGNPVQVLHDHVPSLTTWAFARPFESGSTQLNFLPDNNSRTPVPLTLSGNTFLTLPPLFLTPVVMSPCRLFSKKVKITWRRVGHSHGNLVLHYRQGYQA